MLGCQMSFAIRNRHAAHQPAHRNILSDAGHMLAVTPDSMAKRRARRRIDDGGTPNPLYELEGRTAHRTSELSTLATRTAGKGDALL